MRHHPRATTLGELPALAAEQWPEREAVVLGDERLSFAGFEAGCARRAAELRGLGVGRGDRVGILMTNSVEYLLTIFGAAKLGAVPVPVNNRFSAAELAHVVADSELGVLVISSAGGRDPSEAVGAALAILAEGDAPAGGAALRHVVDVGAEADREGVLGRAGLAAAGADVAAAEVAAMGAAVAIADPAMIIYTSGTTSRPKGCVLNGEGLTRTAFTVAEERFGFGPTDRCWDPLPFCHLSSLVILNACLVSGAAFVSAERFQAGPALAQLEAERCTFAYPCFDTITAALQDHPDFAATDLSALRIVVTIGVVERLRAWQERWPGAAQLGAYGATEYSGVLCYNRPTDSAAQRFETCGPPIPGMEIRVVDPETGAPRAPGERGELHCRGYGVFAGYFRDPEQTARVMTEDGWIRSGDLVAVDGDGYVSYLGRLKDMIKVGGENVAAAEVEDVLVTHPDLREAQVVGLPDEKYVEVPVAFVEARPGAEVSPEEVLAFCGGQLARFKVPRRVFFVTEWPMSETKIIKQALREEAARLV
jgi:fatty-acyl-CoA synthase